jgi:hypothetical protein
MNYKALLHIIVFFLVTSCATTNLNQKKTSHISHNIFKNKGFALLYSESDYKNKIISKKIDNRGIIIFQRNLKKNTEVKITNLINNYSIIATVGVDSTYPSFYNSVIPARIFKELEINFDQPYVEIVSINKNSTFFIKKAKTFDEEKQVANKAPVQNISVNDLNISTNKIVIKKDKLKNFQYDIKIADFYYDKSAQSMSKRIKLETPIKKVNVKKMSANSYRVYLGPFYNLNSLQNAFNDINILGFENVEIIKNN